MGRIDKIERLRPEEIEKRSIDKYGKGENSWLGFPHLYYPSNPFFAKMFVEKAREFKKKQM